MTTSGVPVKAIATYAGSSAVHPAAAPASAPSTSAATAVKTSVLLGTVDPRYQCEFSLSGTVAVSLARYGVAARHTAAETTAPVTVLPASTRWSVLDR